MLFKYDLFFFLTKYSRTTDSQIFCLAIYLFGKTDIDAQAYTRERIRTATSVFFHRFFLLVFLLLLLWHSFWANSNFCVIYYVEIGYFCLRMECAIVYFFICHHTKQLVFHCTASIFGQLFLFHNHVRFGTSFQNSVKICEDNSQQ